MRIFNLTIAALATIGYVLCLLSEKFWLAELVIHWLLHGAAACLFFAIVFLLQKRKIIALYILVLGAGFFIPVMQPLAPAPAPQGKEIARLKILQFNIYYGNEQFKDSISWILEQNADIVVLQEVNPVRAAELGELKKHYSWSEVKVNNHRDAFGMAIFSNLPVEKFEYIKIGNGWNNYSKTIFSLADKKLHLYELHTPPPMSKEFAEQRNFAMQTVAEEIADDKNEYKILVGDLNTTVYSPYFKQLTDKTKMNHAQQNYNFVGSWHADMPKILRLGIDHLAASPQIKIEKRATGEYFDSDHLPVISEISLYE